MSTEPNLPPPERRLGARETAKLMGVCLDTLYKRIRVGGPRPAVYDLGGTYWFDRREVEDWIRSRRRVANEEVA